MLNLQVKTEIVAGKIYLIPVHLGSDDFRNVIPEKVLLITRSLRFFVVENLRSSRRYLRLIDKEFPIDETQFFELNEHTDDSGIDNYLDPVRNGFDLGVMSEAGLPGIADPGAKIIALAHRKGIKVVPFERTIINNNGPDSFRIEWPEFLIQWVPSGKTF